MKFYVGENLSCYQHNLKRLPGLVRVDDFDQLNQRVKSLHKDDVFFFLEEDELLFDTYRVNDIKHVRESVDSLIDSCKKLKKDYAHVQTITLNYMPYPPKIIAHTYFPKVFKASAYSDELRAVDVQRNSKKVMYNMILFTVYKQISSEIEIGKVFKGETPKYKGLM